MGGRITLVGTLVGVDSELLAADKYLKLVLLFPIPISSSIRLFLTVDSALRLDDRPSIRFDSSLDRRPSILRLVL